VTSAEAVRIWRQQRYNPIRSATPATLARALENFEIGDLREAALLFESIAERDDTLMSVKPKREKEVSQLDKQVMAIPGSGAEGEEHKEILEDFWNNVTAINAYDRNQKGKFRRLVKQMMTCVSFRYAAHHIVWQVRNGKLRATFEFIPLWLFENRTGTLRYLENPWAQEGKALADGEWMITAGDGLMIACSIGWSAKRNAFNDWLIFSAKFSVPGTLGRTSSAKDSPEGRAMHEAVRTFGHDWAGVIYGDDGTHQEPIKIIQAAGNPSGMPMPAVVERVDRKFAALYRGADLSTMSAGSGEGSGASLQEKEGDILLSDDAETISETLEEISKKVIEWHFGYGVEPLARLELIVPKREDTTNLVNDASSLADRGAKVSKSALMDRLSLQTATDEADTLQPAGAKQAITPQEPRQEIANAMDNYAQSEWLHEIRSALATDLRPLGDALAGAMEAGDLPAMQAALRQISKNMPELAGDAAALSEVMTRQMTEALVGSEEVANGDWPGHPFRGNQWTGYGEGGGGGKTSRRVDSIPEVIHAATMPGNQTFCDWGDVDSSDVEMIKEQFGIDLTGGKRVIVADEVRKILRDHGSDPVPVTYQDIEQLPQNIRKRAKVLVSEREGKHPRLISLIPNGNTTIVVEEVRTGRNKLALVSMHKAAGNDLAKITRTLRAIPERKRRADG
jgi:phage gp29-like protein